VFLPLSAKLAPLLRLGAGLTGIPLVPAAIGIVVGIFGQVTINDAILGEYTSEEWQARAYAARNFLGFTAAGVSVSLAARARRVHAHAAGVRRARLPRRGCGSNPIRAPSSSPEQPG
jgi:hypothetical protein